MLGRKCTDQLFYFLIHFNEFQRNTLFTRLQPGFPLKADTSSDRHDCALFKVNNDDCRLSACLHDRERVHGEDLVAAADRPLHGLGGATSGCDHVCLKCDMARPMYSDSNNPLDLSSEQPQSAFAKQNGGLVVNPNDNDDRGRADKSDYGDERHLNGLHLGATNGCAGKFL